MRIVHVVEGDVEVEAVRRAIELSATKYCTVTGNLASGVTEIQHAYLVRDAAGEEHYGEVVVTGPGESPDSLGQRHGAAKDAGRRLSPRGVRPRSRLRRRRPGQRAAFRAIALRRTGCRRTR